MENKRIESIKSYSKYVKKIWKYLIILVILQLITKIKIIIYLNSNLWLMSVQIVANH